MCNKTLPHGDEEGFFEHPYDANGEFMEVSLMFYYTLNNCTF